MMSLEDIAAIKVAVQICNHSELKRIILTYPESGLIIKRMSDRYNLKQQWDELVEKKAIAILEMIGLPEQLQEKIVGIALLTGVRMLTWAKYHEGTLGFSREYSINFLNGSFFTSRGIIDNEKAADVLMNDKNLSIKRKYQLACLYCFTDQIPVLYNQISKEDKEEFSHSQIPGWVNRPGLIEFWTNCMMVEIDKLNDTNIDLCRLARAVEIGSKAAVEYCLERTSLKQMEHALKDAAIKTIRKKSTIMDDDWIVFQQNKAGSWVPNDNYTDILCFVLSKMREDQQIEFLIADMEDVENQRYCNDRRCSRVLEYFLNWPYNEYFVRTAGLMWEFLPEVNYAVLLLMICDKIESQEWKSLKYGEQKCCDYRTLLMEFWNQSPERFKRYVFSNENVTYRTDGLVTFKSGVGLLRKLLTLKNFTYKDKRNIRLIFDSTENNEKENILSSDAWKYFCIRLIRNEKFEILDRVSLICFPSKAKVKKFKFELIFRKEVLDICIDFLKMEKRNAADLLMNWSSLPIETMNILKKLMIYSNHGRRVYLDLISCDKRVRAVDKFVRWYFPSESQTNVFKKMLIFTYSGVFKCAGLIAQNEFELVNEFISFSLSSSEDIRELKKKVAYRVGFIVYNELLPRQGNFEYKREGGVYRDIGYFNISWLAGFTKHQLEKIEKFSIWCFSSEKEIREYKKTELLKKSFTEIHFQLIKCNQLKEAAEFFAWLRLSDEEIKDLKKQTLFHYKETIQMFKELMDGEDKRFAFYGGTQKAIELFSKWFLTDKETILKFNDLFKRQYPNITEDEAVLKKFDLMIEQRLKDLD